LGSIQEAEHELGEALGLLEWREGPAAVQHLEARTGKAARVGFAVGGGEQAVPATPHDEGRCGEPPEAAPCVPATPSAAPSGPRDPTRRGSVGGSARGGWGASGTAVRDSRGAGRGFRARVGPSRAAPEVARPGGSPSRPTAWGRGT